MANQLYDLTGVPIFSVGVWNKDVYGEADLDAMVAAYSQVGWKPPLKLGHDPAQKFADGMPALGWVGNLRRVGKQLVADFTQMPRAVWDAIKRKAYNRVSAEVYWDYADGGKHLPRVLKAVALLGADIPAVTNLGTLEGLYDQAGKPFKAYDFGIEQMPGMPPPMMETANMPMAPKRPKAVVGYMEAGDDPYGRCGACKFFCGPPCIEGDFIGSCNLVDGEVSASFTCDMQQPRDAFTTASKKADKVKTHAFPPADSATPDPNNPANKNVDAKLTVQPDVVTGEFCVFRGDQKVQCFPTQEEADALLAKMETEPNAEEEKLGPDGEPLPTPVANVSIQDKLKLAGDAIRAVSGVIDALDKGLAGNTIDESGKKPDEDEKKPELGPDGKPVQKDKTPLEPGKSATSDAGKDPNAEPVKKKSPFPGAKPFAEQLQRSYVIQRQGSKFVLRSKTTGKVLGEHDTYEKAQAQELAIQASKAAARKFEMTADQMAPLCASCADKMRLANIRAYKFFLGPVKIYGVERGVPLGKVRYFAVGPNADALCAKFGEDAGFFTKCQEHMSGKPGIDNPEGFCAELHKHCTGKYPSEKPAEKAMPEKMMTRYAVEQRKSGLWDLCRETGSRVATYATEQEARAAQARLEDKQRCPFGVYGVDFDESKHPRNPPGSEGAGQFAAGGGGGGTNLKAAWQMTRKEWVAHNEALWKKDPSYLAQRVQDSIRASAFDHATAVAAAVDTGKPVPASVLADYPDLIKVSTKGKK